MKSLLQRLPHLVLVLLLTTFGTFAQQQGSITGGLNGVVSDASGAVIPGATVTLHGPQGDRALTTDTNGRFSANNLTPGLYDVTATKEGFMTTQSKQNEVVVNASSTLNLTMQVGSVGQTVEVSTSAVAIDTTGAAYVAGDSDAASNFLPTPTAFQTTSSVGPAAIVAKFAPAPAMTLATSDASVDAQTPVTLTATLPGFTASGTVAFMDGSSWIGSAAVVSSRASLTVTLPAGIHALNALMVLPGSSADAPPVTQIVDVPLVCR